MSLVDLGVPPGFLAAGFAGSCSSVSVSFDAPPACARAAARISFVDFGVFLGAAGFSDASSAFSLAASAEESSSLKEIATQRGEDIEIPMIAHSLPEATKPSAKKEQRTKKGLLQRLWIRLKQKPTTETAQQNKRKAARPGAPRAESNKASKKGHRKKYYRQGANRRPRSRGGSGGSRSGGGSADRSGNNSSSSGRRNRPSPTSKGNEKRVI